MKDVFVTESIKYIGVDDREIDLFESQYIVPNGVSYNSYVIMDEKIAVMDTVDARFTHAWLDNLQYVLGGKSPDYLVVQHMEPDHSANIHNFVKNYSKILPSVEMVTIFQGINFPLFIRACLVALSIPPQQGTSILTTVTLLMLLPPIIAVSFSV